MPPKMSYSMYSVRTLRGSYLFCVRGKDIVKVSIAALNAFQKENGGREDDYHDKIIRNGNADKTTDSSVTPSQTTTIGAGEEPTYHRSLLTNNSISMVTDNYFGAEFANQSTTNNNKTEVFTTTTTTNNEFTFAY